MKKMEILHASRRGCRNKDPTPQKKPRAAETKENLEKEGKHLMHQHIEAIQTCTTFQENIRWKQS